MANIYESDRLLAEYLLFHYGKATEILPYSHGPHDALHFPTRCITENLDTTTLPANAMALDIGCAVGRSSFELARHCPTVIGIDYSARFIEAAQNMQQSGSIPYNRIDEGIRTTPLVAEIPTDVDAARITFETGDACNLRHDLPAADVLLAANLLCRLPDPRLFLNRLPSLVKPGGQLIITTPCSWLEEFTPRDKWLCNETQGTFEALQKNLSPHFDLINVRDMPMLIREHARKFQWTVVQASQWRRRDN